MMMMRQNNHIGRRKKQSGKIPPKKPAVTIQTLSTNLVKQQPEIQVRLRKTNQIIIEQSKDAPIEVTPIEGKTSS